MMKKYLYLLLLFFSVAAEAREKCSNDDLWILRTTDYQASYVGAAMANGRIGILPWKQPFEVRHVVLNHVFDRDGEQGVSRVLKGVNPFLLSIELDGIMIDSANISGWCQEIDMRRAVHRTSFIAMGKLKVTYDLCALRNMPYAGMIQVQVEALTDCALTAAAHMEIPEDYRQGEYGYREVWADGTPVHTLKAVAYSAHRAQEVSASSAFLLEHEAKEKVTYDDRQQQLGFTRCLKQGENYSFALVGAICTSRDFSDPYNESERQVIYAMHEGASRLFEMHCRLWNELWQGDVRIEGDDNAQRAVRFALFNLYASCREGSRLSVSPMGLSLQGYNGHVFWDTEMWMYPPMLFLNQGIARSMIDYRIDRLEPARRRAMTYGYRGAMFPWESDDMGEEATPTFALTGPFEHHITADIGIACWNYYCMTRDRAWLQAEGYPLLKEVAAFWVSRVSENPDASYSVRNVTGADEYANGVDDNAFTNAAVIQVLDYACKSASICGEKVPEEWKQIRDKLRILRFPDEVIREHATYDGEMIKQADANLLGYPLCWETDANILRKTLAYYADKIDPQHGPAMSYSVFCVQYARLGDADKAYEMFRRCYEPNLRMPFGVLTETPASNNPYFVTGAGGLLQAVINGFCGLHLTEEGIVQLPSVLPKHWKKVTVTGVGPDRQTFARE